MLFAKDRFCGIALGFCGVMGTATTTCIATSGPVISKLFCFAQNTDFSSIRLHQLEMAALIPAER